MGGVGGNICGTVTAHTMVIKTKTKEQICQWFGDQWKEICMNYERDYKTGKLARLEKMFAGLSGKTEIKFSNPLQKPYTFYLPDLPTQEFFDASSFKLARVLEENYETIRDELERVLTEDREKFAEYMGDGINSDKNGMTNKGGEWKVFYFWQQFLENTENTKRCPNTFQLLQQLKKEGLLLGGMVCFSSLMPGTHIIPHTGPSNMRLTCHLGLMGCNNTTINVGTESSQFKEGKCIIFDDSYIHEVIHRGDSRRVTLMLDFWHPAMTHLEIEIFSSVMNNSANFMHPDEFFHSLKLVDVK